MALEAAVQLTVESVRLRRADPGTLAKRLGEPLAVERRPRGVAPPPIVDEAAREAFQRGKRIGRMVERVAGVLPWKPVCLPQALATSAMLRRRGVDHLVQFGVRTPAEMRSHAWVTVSGWTVVGLRIGEFTPVAAFRRR